MYWKETNPMVNFLRSLEEVTLGWSLKRQAKFRQAETG